MSRGCGQRVVSWLERGGERFLKSAQPYVYQQFLHHVGATDLLQRYDGSKSYWQYVQAILDCFFTTAQRASLCAELMRDPLFAGRDDFRDFAAEARAELRAQDIIVCANTLTNLRASVRSVG